MSYQTITIQLPQASYPVYVGQSLLKQTSLLDKHIAGTQVMIVTQKNIAEFYLKDLLTALKAYRCDVTFLPQGEKFKNLQTWRKLMDNLVTKEHERSTTLIALGGGVVGDVTGFAAACYHRGVNYIQIPTTVLAQVDSAIGGKTGVNYPSGKNLIGAFHHPSCVLADLSTLKTLPRREFVAGFAEVIKYGLIRDAAFFSWLEAKLPFLLEGDPEALLQAIATSVRIKGEIVSQDSREQSGLRSLLNFGHTLGHALEALFNYRDLLHGEAVAIGMAAAAQLSMEKGWLTEQENERIKALLALTTLPLVLNKKIDREKLFSYLMRDKKVQANRMKWILMKGIGEAFMTDQVAKEEVMKILPCPV
jgi:3-dehydroquinate synthase